MHPINLLCTRHGNLKCQENSYIHVVATLVLVHVDVGAFLYIYTCINVINLQC